MNSWRPCNSIIDANYALQGRAVGLASYDGGGEEISSSIVDLMQPPKHIVPLVPGDGGGSKGLACMAGLAEK